MNKFIALAIVVGMAPFAFADGNEATAIATSCVKIICPITITKTADLDFGTFVANGGGGIVTIGCDGTVNSALTGNIWAYKGANSPHCATFEIKGEDGYPFQFIAPPDVDLLGTGPGMLHKFKVMIGTFESLKSNLPTTVKVGGILTLVSPLPGTYTGSFKATVCYL